MAIQRPQKIRLGTCVMQLIVVLMELRQFQRQFVLTICLKNKNKTFIYFAKIPREI